MRNSQKRIIILFSIALFLIGVQFLSFKFNSFVNLDNEKDSISNESVEDQNKTQEELKTSLSYGNNSFSDVGDPQNVSLFHSLNKTFVNNRTSDGGIALEDSTGQGWNMTGFELNFTEIYTTEKYVEFFTRNDGADKFLDYKDSRVWYATSFKIPNTCYLKNISLFIQFWGGLENNADMIFNITIFNSKEEEGKLKPAFDISDNNDQKEVDLSGKSINQPATWYQANFSNILLDVGETKNNTFFAVFHVVEWGLNQEDEAYYYYSVDRETDEYRSTFLKSIDDGSTFTELSGKNGMLKVNLAPIEQTPDPTQVNLTVFNHPVNKDGTYNNQSFFEHEENDFDIPITSPWFADVVFNVSFSGNFKYNVHSSTIFNATGGKEVHWNSTLDINQYPTEGYDYQARFYKPSYWKYNTTYNGTKIFNDNFIDSSTSSDYIEILDSSNDEWTISYNQSSNVIKNIDMKASSNQNLWYNVDKSINITDYLNVSFTSNNSNGVAFLRIKSDGYTKLFEETINTENTYFEPWRIDRNTTITENNTLFQLNIMTKNGTVAGIKTHRLRTKLSEMNATLVSQSNSLLKNEKYNFNFSLKNDYNSENVSIDTLSIKYEKTEDNWVNLIRDFHYKLYSNPQKGIYNISINTDLSEFLAGNYRINFTFSDSEIYFFNKLYNDTLNINKRNLDISILGSTYSNRTYSLGSKPNYTLYLEDSIENYGVSDLDFEVYANLSQETPDVKFESNYFTVNDLGDGDYNITINTETLFTDWDLQNLTLEFRAQKEGIYNAISEKNNFSIYHDETHRTQLNLKEQSSSKVEFGDLLWVTLEFKDLSIVSSDDGLDNAFFVLKHGETYISDQYFQDEDLGNGDYNITIEMEPFDFHDQISLEIIADRPDKFTGDNRTTYTSSSLDITFDYIKANFDINYNKISKVYTNDTVSRIPFQLSSDAGVIETASFNVKLGPNTLSVASLGSGSFQIFMDSTNLTIGKSYLFSISIQKPGFGNYFDTYNVSISPYDAAIQIPENFQDLRVYQQQTIRMVSILSNTFTEREILDAQVRMIINGTNSYSNNFTQIANQNGWYEGTLNVGDVSPGNHSLIIEMKKDNYTPINFSTSIFILERADTVLTLTEDLKRVYVWGDIMVIPVKLTEGESPLVNFTINFQFTETYRDGNLNIDNPIATTNENGVAKIEHLIPENIQQIEISISFKGTNSLEPIDLTISEVNFRSPGQQTFINMIPFIPIIIGGVVGVSGYSVYRVVQRRKHVEKWKEKAQIFKDAQNVRFLLVLDLMSGQPIIQKDFGKTGFDGALIGGLIQAMTNFLQGLQKEKPKENGKTTMHFDYKENEILLRDGEYSRGVLMLNESPSEETKNALSEFVDNFEEQYGQYLQPFKGNLREFQGYQKLIDESCKTRYLRKFQLNRNPPEKELDTFHEKVLSISKTFELISEKNFDLNSLIDYVKSNVEDVLEERITAAIIDLVDDGFLKPILQQGKKKAK